jgi:cytochrome c oxidase cbb3-type subunit 3
MSGTVGVVIAVVVLANIAGALWLIWWTMRGSSQTAAGETTHVWDGDLTEYNNPLPRWWLWLFILSILFGLGYLVVFPGLGGFRGLAHWTEVGQWRTEEQAAHQAFERRFAGLEGKSLMALSADADAMATAKNLFALNCSACHGSDARGAKGFPNLTDQDWLWGGAPQTIYQTIAQGRDGLMPAWGPVLGPKGVEQVLAYVETLSGRPAPAELVEAGKAQFQTLCSGCHALDGGGNPALGAPNLKDDIWLHGGSEADIRASITGGRTNHMPAQLERLGETKVRLLAAYVYGLSPPAAPAVVQP